MLIQIHPIPEYSCYDPKLTSPNIIEVLNTINELKAKYVQLHEITLKN